MKIISWEDFISENYRITKPSSATIGVFDGVHYGHKYIIDKLNDKNIEEKVVFTFIQNPIVYIKKRTFEGNIYSLDQKLKALESAGATITVLIDFSSDFSKLKGEYFIGTLLEHMNLRKIVLGKDFRCGVDNDTGAFDIFNMLKKRNIEVVIVNRQNYKNIPVSSSDIRKLIMWGDISRAEELLPFGYSLDLSDTEILSEKDYFYADTDEINQLLPNKDRFIINLKYDNKTSEKEVFIDKRIIKWFDR